MPGKKGSQKRHRRYRKRCSRAYRNKMIMGGDGAGYAQAVYGGIDGQHAASPATNVIAMNAQAAAAMRGGDASPNAATIGGLSPAPMMGGRRRRRKGGNPILTDLAVPAVLLVANQAMSRRRRSSSKRRSHRRHRR